MPDGFTYDVFISYSSADRAWADQLEKDLAAKQVKGFLDTQGLRAGESWPDRLLQALQASRHLVVLWSENARDSDWVQKELHRFEAIVDPDGKQLLGERRIVIVLLESENKAFAHVQQIGDLKQANAYASPLDAESDIWKDVVRRVAEAVGAEEGSVRIPLLLVTTTGEELDKIDADAVPPDGVALSALVTQLGFESMDGLGERYGQSRREWRPFDGARSVETILDDLRDRLNADIDKLNARAGPNGVTWSRFGWEYVDGEFWGSPQEADSVAQRLRSGPVLVVVDPLAFYVPLVSARYTTYVLDILDNSAAFVLVLTPFALPAASVALRSALQQLARKIFTHFYDEPPAFGGSAYARCGPNVGDDVEFKGWLAAALGPNLPPAGSTGSVYLAPATRT